MTTNVYGPTNGSIQYRPMAEASLPALGPGATYLTIDALLTYCESRMRYLDEQVATHFAEQQRSARHTQILSGLSECFGAIQGGFNDGASVAHDIIRAYQAAICDAGGADTEVGRKLMEQQAAFIATVGTNGGAALRAEMNDPDYWTKPVAADKGKVVAVSEQTVKRFTDAIGRLQESVNQGSELGMIRLQSIMSQRQTALQITTGMMQSLNEMTNKIAANIGH